MPIFNIIGIYLPLKRPDNSYIMKCMSPVNQMADLKKKAYLLLKNSLINGLDKGEISNEEMRNSARYIQHHLEAVESLEELLLLLNEIGDKWQIYKGVFVEFKHMETSHEDAQKMEALQEKLRQFAVAKT